ncbi:MAG: tRNA (adenosine(37)-N6)-dimethylallyltransferase MiaA [Planctomycetia bacterium]|nr:tRNA (adenosine(37)-N6)-dimethylallyltransferase MiaA [Planctomycetia bacterium]
MTIFSEKCYFLTGPTACGKTSFALELAESLNAEILSMDSVAIFCGMDIGSAKPTREEQAQVRHHLLDIVEPSRDFSVADYMRHAEESVREILERGKAPLFVGGTPLYLKSLIFGLFESPPADASFREEMKALAQIEAEKGNNSFLHDKLKKVDPDSAARLHPNDTKRLIRALEVFSLTGKTIGEFQTQFEKRIPDETSRRIKVVDIPRATLHERINFRVDQMFEKGLLDETRQLLKTYPDLSATARQAVGYRETLAYLAREEAGETPSFEELKEEIKAHTRQLAKRQITWFRALFQRDFQF